MDLRLMLGKVGGTAATTRPGQTGKAAATTASDFSLSLNQALDRVRTPTDLKVTAHAATRLNERGIDYGALKERLESAVAELATKGARDSLVVLKEGAFVVNVPHRTLITALAPDDMRDRIVTNIDSVHLKES